MTGVGQSFVNLPGFDELREKLDVSYGAPAPAPLTPVTPVPHEPPPSNVKVLEHLVGATVVRLENGDVIRCHLFVTEFCYSSEHQQYLPAFRVVPEVELSARGRSIFPAPDGEVN